MTKISHKIYKAFPQSLRSYALRTVTQVLAPSPLLWRKSPPAITPQTPCIIVGLLRSPYSFGILARQIAEDLKNHTEVFGIDLSDAFPQNTSVAQNHNLFPPPKTDRTYRLILVINAPQTPYALMRIPRWILKNAFISGYWAWELESIPKSWCVIENRLDEIIVPSGFVREAVHKRFPNKKITFMPPPLKGNLPPLADFQSMLQDPLVVLSSCNMASSAERKNPLGTAMAFMEAFPAQSGPVLRLHLNNPDAEPEAACAIQALVKGRSDIELSMGTLPREAYLNWWEGGHLFCSLHRAEGFGLGLAEAMASGYAAMGTAYSAPLDFMTQDNSFLIDYTKVEIKEARFVKGFRQGFFKKSFPKPFWADPDLAQACSVLRTLNQERDILVRKAMRGKKDMSVYYDGAGRKLGS